jgi:hypothetical protein
MSFDADTLLNTDVSDAASTEYVPIPIGEWTGIIQSVGAKEVTSQKNGEIYRFLEVQYTIDDQEVKDETQMSEPKCRQSMILDFTEAGTLDLGKGKNVNLGRLREACSQNEPGKAWNFNMLVGQAVKVSVKHRTGDEGQIYAEIKGVAKL